MMKQMIKGFLKGLVNFMFGWMRSSAIPKGEEKIIEYINSKKKKK